MLQNSFKLAAALYKVKSGQHIQQRKFMCGALHVLSKLIDFSAHMAYEKNHSLWDGTRTRGPDIHITHRR